MKYLPVLSLLFIVIIGFFLRFYQLGNVPVGFHRDEAFFGYNAYSLLLTGHDMTGNFLPVHLQSFLYSPGGYSYVTIPFISLFGLNEFAVRFASALFGSLTVLIAYFFVRELFSLRDKQEQSSLVIALVSSFLLAISPWHVNLSRVATENVLVVFLITLGVWLYFLWIRKQTTWLLVVSFFAFGITLTLYQAPRAFLPFFIPLLFLFFHPKPVKKHIVVPVILFFFIILLPIMMILSSHDLTQRIRMLSIFQHPGTQLVLDEQIREDEGTSPLITRFFHNKAINYSITFLENYFNHFSYNFLMLDQGYPDRYRVPQMGLLYFFELPLLLFGMWKLFVNHRRIAGFLIGWILLAPLGSALTYDDIPNLQRTLIIFPALSIVIAYGLIQLWQLLSRVKFGRIGKVFLIFVMVYGFLYYLHQYFIHQINHQPWRRQEGYKALIAQLNTIHMDYKKVVVTDVESTPAIFFMFYNQMDPKRIQEQFAKHPTENYGELSLDKFVFVKNSCPLHVISEEGVLLSKEPKLSAEEGVLYVNGPNCDIEDSRIVTVSEIRRSDRSVVFTLQTMKE